MTPTELVLKPGQTVKLHARLVRRARADSCARRRPRGALDGPEGHGRRRHRSRWPPIRSNRPGLIKATVGELKGEARARVVRPLPWTETFESYADGAVAAGLDQRDAREVQRRDARRPEGAAEGAGRHDLPADPHVLRADRLVQLHDRGRRAVERRSAGRWPTSASRRSAIRSCCTATTQKTEARAVGAGDPADGHGAVRVEARHVVSPEAARREHAGRQGAARAARPGRPARPNPRRGRSTRSIRSAIARAPPGFFADAEFGAYFDNLKIAANR